MRLFKKVIKYIILILIICLLFILFLPSRTPQIEGENSIASIQRVELGGLDQFILVRGKDVSNPIILFLHGGPGYPQISFARRYQEKLEKSFIVVNWDQRGSGKSYSNNIPKETMSREQFIKDTKELIDYLCKKYGKEKIYLAGHSWGSDLGLHVIKEYPEKVAAFISIGQMVNGIENERISYDYVFEMAQKNKDTRALEDLERIGRPPYKNQSRDIMIQRRWLSKYHGVERQTNTLNDIVLGSIFSPEYTGLDGIKFLLGWKFTSNTMFGNNIGLDFMRDIPEVKVPIYFCVGVYDYNTPSELIEKYYNQLIAPEKELILFEESAHYPHFEESEKFTKLAIRIKEMHEKR